MDLRTLALLVVTVTTAPGAAAQQAAPPAIRYDGHISVAGSPPPSGQMKNPFKGDAKVADEGGKLFSGFNCDGCHGGGAVGAVGPSLVDGRWRYGGSDGEIFHSIFYGRPRGMPAFGGFLPAESMWKLVTYLQSLQPAKDTLATAAW